MDTDPNHADRVESNAVGDDATASVVGADGRPETVPDGGRPDEEAAAEPDETGTGGPLTITLPDGSESVSEAILSNRQMLTNPSENGLASAEETTEAREAIETLSEEIPEDLQGEVETLRGSIEGMTARLDRHERRIDELQETVQSLGEILGASVELDHRE
jgi:hypothetical protein